MTLSPRGRMRVREGVANAVKRAHRGGASLDELARRFGVTSKQVGRWASGACWPSLTVAQRIARLVGVDPESGERRKAS